MELSVSREKDLTKRIYNPGAAGYLCTAARTVRDKKAT